MPLYHSTALLMAFASVMASGATLALGRRFSTSRFWQEVRRHDASIIQYVGEAARYLLAAPVDRDPASGRNLDRTHRVRLAFGNGLRPDVWNRFKERFGIETIAEFYGATEGTFATFNLSRNDFSVGAVGRHGWLYNLSVGRSLAIVRVDHETDLPWRDPDTGLCTRVAVGQPGELLFRLPASDVRTRYQGYYGDAAATDKKMLRRVLDRDDCWFRTGDVMRRDGENRLYFVDRLGDTFRWKSENVSTAEVAAVVGTHPQVQEAVVYGVALPRNDGRAGCAAVVLRDGGSGTGTNTVMQDLARLVVAHLPAYARPLFVRLVEPGAIRRTGTNKQQKHELRSQGVEPARTGLDPVYWLRDGSYTPFGPRQWASLEAGEARL